MIYIISPHDEHLSGCQLFLQWIILEMPYSAHVKSKCEKDSRSRIARPEGVSVRVPAGNSTFKLG